MTNTKNTIADLIGHLEKLDPTTKVKILTTEEVPNGYYTRTEIGHTEMNLENEYQFDLLDGVLYIGEENGNVQDYTEFS
jgi:hypothetical protein